MDRQKQNKKQSKQSFGLVSCYALSLSEIQPLPSLKITCTPTSSLLEWLKKAIITRYHLIKYVIHFPSKNLEYPATGQLHYFLLWSTAQSWCGRTTMRWKGLIRLPQQSCKCSHQLGSSCLKKHDTQSWTRVAASILRVSLIKLVQI